METKQDSLFAPLARLLLSTYFVLDGVGYALNWRPAIDAFVNRGLPIAPLWVMLSAVIEVTGGVAILAGYRTTLSAKVLFFYMIAMNFLFHSFWFGGADSYTQASIFLSNIAIIGGLAQLIAFGPGIHSMDSRLAARPRATTVTSRAGGGPGREAA